MISSISANVLAAMSGVAAFMDKLPTAFLPAAMVLFGGSGVYLLHRFLPSGGAAAKYVALAMAVTLASTVFYWTCNQAWPGKFPLGRQEDGKTGKRGPTSGAASGNLARGLKVTEPRALARIGTCAAVVGTGQIPEGYQVWVAHLRDRDGVADRSGLYNLHRAPETKGGGWSTGLFGVGTDADVGKDFWIFVYLVPDSVGSVVENLIRPEKWNPSLSAPIVDTGPFAEIPVHKIKKQTC